MHPSDCRRIDMHCHSEASNRAQEVMLNAISCPECFSRPMEVYAQAKNRGMDFVTITDHDSIEGVLTISDRPDVLVGEELTCWFPEDDCKMHILMWGITSEQHQHLQKVARDIYAVAHYFAQQNIAHSVAHPIYRQNDKLERWHLERLLILFKGFECLNGSHSALHRDAFEPLLANLSRTGLIRLTEKHNLQPLWPEPWIKARTAGSDDHGLLNIGRTWTEFPNDTKTVADVLQCIRDGTCKPGGENGSAVKLAHAIYSVGVRYYTHNILNDISAAGTAKDGKTSLPIAKKKKSSAGNFTTLLLQMIVGEKQMPGKAQLIKMQLKSVLKKTIRRATAPFKPAPPPTGTAMLRKLFIDSVRRRVKEHPNLRKILESGLPPLGEHEEMFQFVQDINRDITEGISNSIFTSVQKASFTGLFDSIASILAHQFILAPYYFAVFHQNRERNLLHSITGQGMRIEPKTIRVGLFTDTLDETNGVTRFLSDMSTHAILNGCHLTVHTCSDAPTRQLPTRKNFKPLLSREMPYYEDLKLNLPPIIEILDWVDKSQFDVIHISTPGPMGICGWLAAKMLKVPILGTYHTDFPAYIENYTGDHRATRAASAYMAFLCSKMTTVFTRSKGYVHALRGLGVPNEKLRTLHAGVDTEKFNPRHRDESIWQKLGVKHQYKLICCGRVSLEKNLPLLSKAFIDLCARRNDTALLVAGDGPYMETMKKELAGLPVHFLGCISDNELSPLYATADLLVFPSRTDTLGQVVMEAQASGLPSVVSNEGGPMETVSNGETGVVIQAVKHEEWVDVIDALLNNPELRKKMSIAAPPRMIRYSLARSFEDFWEAHVAAVQPKDHNTRLDQAVYST